MDERGPAQDPSAQAAPPPDQAGPPSVAARLAFYQRAGGIVTPLLTAILAFLIGGIVVLVSGHNPLTTYKEIFNGTGLNWFFHIETGGGFPWIWEDDSLCQSEACGAASNLQQTLLLMVPLILTGLAVAFAFRCGLFNIGGQGQYLIGALVAAWVGSSWAGLGPEITEKLGPWTLFSAWNPLHTLVVIALASLAGAVWAGIAGVLKATVGAHEVVTTIMLNWIAIWIASYAVGQGGPLQNTANEAVPVSSDVTEGSKIPVFWGDPILQGLHIGFFAVLAMLVVFWVVLNRTTLGYEVRAVGFNPEAARYGGISVRRSYFLAMAISGFFAGLAGAFDILGWQFRIGVIDVQSSNVAFIGIAVALLGRNTAIGVGLSALLFAALVNGTSTRHLSGETFPPELAGNLTLMIQALVLLFVGADLLILYLWRFRRKVFGRRAAPVTSAS
jgi:general nucleoside transport system permease protein